MLLPKTIHLGVETAPLKTSKQEAEEGKKNPSTTPAAGESHLGRAVKQHTLAHKYALAEERHMGTGSGIGTEQMWI